ncbi:MAG: hypothetical protein E7595_05305 [Ruminococcaceae bacterium]|nr:hypothetical protein [Oscillospiraceae bacterium]
MNLRRIVSVLLLVSFALLAVSCSSSVPCIKCGKEVGEDDAFCPSCGTEQTKIELVCPKCNKENAEGSKYCASCGKPLESVPVHSSGSADENSEGEQQYDPAGEKVLLIKRSNNSSGWYTDFYYDYNGNRIKSDGFNGKGEKNSVYEYYYDEHDNVIKQVYRNFDYNEFSTVTYTNTYDENGRLIKSQSSYNQSYTEYTYNEEGLLELSVYYNTNFYTGEPYKYTWSRYIYESGEVKEIQSGYFDDNDEMYLNAIVEDGRTTYEISGDGGYLVQYVYSENGTDVEVIQHNEPKHKDDFKNCNCDKNTLTTYMTKCDKYGNIIDPNYTDVYMTLAEYREKGLYSEPSDENSTGSNAKCLECNQAGYSSCIGHPCDECGGDGFVTCPSCKGSGVDGYSHLKDYKCTVCLGEKVVICSNNHCVAGKIFYN